MSVINVINAPWAIIPEKLIAIQDVVASHISGEKIDIAAIEARIGKPLLNDQQGGYINNGGVAVIPISGVIGKKFNMMSQISGGASTQLIERDIKAALSDPEINSILLHIDSPGGTVDGTQTLADVVAMAGSVKPVVSFADGLMASAAYWIGSAASEIVASSTTSQIGSIGVVTSHTDISKAEQQAGYKTTVISAGKYKSITSQHAPLSKDGAALLQDQVDQLYTIFVDAVAANRGTDSDTVLSEMADGRVFLGADAKERGMVDHIATLETTILNMQTGVWPMTTKKVEAQAEPVAQIQEVIKLDISAIKEQYPEIVASIKQEGAEAERARIADCESVALAGYESIVNSMKLDGKSTGSDVARAIIAKEKETQASRAKAFIDNAPAPLAHAAVDPVEPVVAADDKSLPIEERAKAKWDSETSLHSEFPSFVAFSAFFKASESGRVKVARAAH
jgi:signal peptide peptidase SppA